MYWTILYILLTLLNYNSNHVGNNDLYLSHLLKRTTPYRDGLEIS
jgi:hypothetical protein